MKIHPDSLKLINKTIEYLKIPENQQFYDQDSYKSKIIKRVMGKRTVCGTECCIGGWMLWIRNPAEYDKMSAEQIRRKLIYDDDILVYQDGSPMNTCNLFGRGIDWHRYGDQYYEVELIGKRSTDPNVKMAAKTILANIAINRLIYFKENDM